MSQERPLSKAEAIGCLLSFSGLLWVLYQIVQHWEIIVGVVVAGLLVVMVLLLFYLPLLYIFLKR